MITIRSYNLFQPSAERTSSRFRPNPAINRWAIFNRPRNADSAEPIFWATPGGLDYPVIEMNQEALPQMRCEAVEDRSGHDTSVSGTGTLETGRLPGGCMVPDLLCRL